MLNIKEILNTVICGDALSVLKTFPDESIDCCITSPPYWALRDYGCNGQLGLEKTFHEFIEKLCNVFDEVKRILKKDGTCWINIGDSYSGSGKGASTNFITTKESWSFNKAPKTDIDLQDKCLCMIPERFAIEMCERGWILRNEIIWYKKNCMPSSVKDRFTVDFEKIFFFVKNKKYYFSQQLEPVLNESLKRVEKGLYQTDCKERSINVNTEKMGIRFCNPKGRNKRTVWEINTHSFSEVHFAVYPEKLIETPIKAGCKENGIVLDPFIGSGTTALVAKKLMRNFIGIELNKDYVNIINKRLEEVSLLMSVEKEKTNEQLELAV